ncbi:unnamed protein product [Urochloa humidicola]
MDLKASTKNNHLECMLLDEALGPLDLPLSLLKDITKDFSDDLAIGRGGFAVVYKGMLRNGIIAVKKLYKSLEIHEDKFIQEVICLMKVKHKNIVRFLGYCADTQGKVSNYKGTNVMADVRQRLLCFEYLPQGSLHNHITDASRGLEWRKRYQIIMGVCEGWCYLHQMNIVHLDLKPANILLDDNMAPKIADFGLSRCFDESKSHTITSNPCGTEGYMAPESFKGVIRREVDIYSLGVIITEVLTGQKGYSPVKNVLESWSTRFGTSVALLEQVRICTEIAIDCMNYDPAKRPDVQHIIEILSGTESKNGCTGRVCMSKVRSEIMPREQKHIEREMPQDSRKVPVKTPYRRPQSIETSKAGSAKNRLAFEQPQSLFESSKRAVTGTQNEMKTVVLYTTTLGSIMKTFENCNGVRAALQLQHISFIEKNLFDTPDYLEELRMLTNYKPYILPVLSISGKYVCDATKLLKLIDQGELATLFH